MPDFTIEVTAGVTVQNWLDPWVRPNVGPLLNPNFDPLNPGDYDPALPETFGEASRLHSRTGHPELRYVGTVGVEIELTATVGGIAAPMDAALGGRLFQAWRIENPAWPSTGFYSSTAPYVFGFTHPAGQTSVQRFTPRVEGHYTIGIRREDGGSMLIHVDVGP